MSLINVNNLTFYYEGSADNIFEDVSFQIDTDWKLGFVARNGRGKTTFLKLLMGEYEYRGSITCDESFDYFPFPIKCREKTFLENIEDNYPEHVSDRFYLLYGDDHYGRRIKNILCATGYFPFRGKPYGLCRTV